jgi:excisionase family DNA binding protein
LYVIFLQVMSKEFTVEEAAEEVGVSGSRIRQMVLANEIDHRYFGRAIVISEKGIKQAKGRNKRPGPAKKETKAA